LVVAPTARRHGTGTALLRMLLDHGGWRIDSVWKSHESSTSSAVPGLLSPTPCGRRGSPYGHLCPDRTTRRG
jgi:hypothetical protein